jgi:fatty acid desaturase
VRALWHRHPRHLQDLRGVRGTGRDGRAVGDSKATYQEDRVFKTIENEPLRALAITITVITVIVVMFSLIALLWSINPWLLVAIVVFAIVYFKVLFSIEDGTL